MRAYNNALWNIFSACNYSCPYCINEASKKDYPGLLNPRAEEWAEAYNRLEGEMVVDITGGEPFLWEGLIEFIHLLSEDKRVAVSTNGSHSFLEFVQKVPPQKCVSITMSYHPSQRTDLQYFIGKALLLKNRGFNVQVNFVTYPEQMWLIPSLAELFSQHEIMFNIDPYRQNRATPYYSYNEREIEFLKKHITTNRKVFFERKKTMSRCDAGNGYFVVMPDGDVYRCLTRSSFDLPLGNLLDPEFSLMPEPAPCYLSCDYACDLDHARREPL